MAEAISEMNYQYFMDTDVSLYIGEWIAIYENKIVAHGKNLKKVIAEAKDKSGGQKFLLARVPSEETVIYNNLQVTK